MNKCDVLQFNFLKFTEIQKGEKYIHSYLHKIGLGS